jgi:hypothetical protein
MYVGNTLNIRFFLSLPRVREGTRGEGVDKEGKEKKRQFYQDAKKCNDEELLKSQKNGVLNEARGGLHSIRPTQSPRLGPILECLCFIETSSSTVVHRVAEVLI